MLPKLRDAEYRGGFRVWVLFADGVEGEVDLYGELWGEMFEPLRDATVFSRLRFDKTLGTIIWENGADFAPEFLYQQLRPGYSLDQGPETGAA